MELISSVSIWKNRFQATIVVFIGDYSMTTGNALLLIWTRNFNSNSRIINLLKSFISIFVAVSNDNRIRPSVFIKIWQHSLRVFHCESLHLASCSEVQNQCAHLQNFYCPSETISHLKQTRFCTLDRLTNYEFLCQRLLPLGIYRH